MIERLPRRVARAAEARRRFGDRLDRLVPWIGVGDPLADAVMAEVDGDEGARGRLFARLAGSPVDVGPAAQALLDDAARVPLWVDFDRIDRAGRLLFRAGPIGGAVLGARSLVSGYASPAGNKPLTFTGALQHAASRRLEETGRFVVAVCSPGGLRPGAEGWQITLRVRLMHAAVRRMALASPRWRKEDWGPPINQHDMLATSLLFSQVWLDGVRTLGLHVSSEDAEDWLHLWRWCSSVMGVAPELLPVAEAEARALAELIALTQGEPDDDARALVDALLSTGPGRHPLVARALCHALLGREMASALGLAPTPLADVLRAAGRVLRPVDRVLGALPGVSEAREALGRAQWAATTEGARRPDAFSLPARLAGLLA